MLCHNRLHRRTATHHLDLVERLKDRGVRFEELIVPDEPYDWLLFRTWLKVTRASATFLTKELAPMVP